METSSITRSAIILTFLWNYWTYKTTPPYNFSVNFLGLRKKSSLPLNTELYYTSSTSSTIHTYLILVVLASVAQAQVPFGVGTSSKE